MNGQPILTDTLVERMLAGRAGKGVPLGLAEAISAQAALTPQARRRWWARDVAPRPQASALQLVWIPRSRRFRRCRPQRRPRRLHQRRS